jgi:hypothetical protein
MPKRFTWCPFWLGGFGVLFYERAYAFDCLEGRDPTGLQARDEVAIPHGLGAEVGSVNAGSSTIVLDLGQQVLDDGVSFHNLFTL